MPILEDVFGLSKLQTLAPYAAGLPLSRPRLGRPLLGRM
jgi:hypothetical protein